ncbi:MAG: xanthine dehydrogenase family protein [Ignavibacteriaceae bacterium]|nr:xanthine dehydrogenase family protein [Ignavibacteriaceae bacterium]
MMNDSFSIVGKKVFRQDAYAKVTGQAKFADDINFPGQLFAVMVRIASAHAKIKSIDYSEVINDSRLIKIIDHSNIPGNKLVGPIRNDQPIFCFDKVVTPGDVICMLIGENVDDLNKLKRKVKIDFEELPVLNDPLKSLEENSPLIHPEFENNLIIHYPLRKGNIEKGFADSDYIIEQTYRTAFVEHAYIEPEAVIAIPQETPNSVKIVGSIQNPFTCRKVVASVLNYPLANVRVIQAELGGSFGGKDDTMNILSARAAIGAMITGRPVKIKYTREESILESYKRHPYILNYKVGAKADGKITAMKIDIIADGGAYSSMSPFVTWRSVVQATGPYEIENVQTDVRAVYTNNPYTGAMRGFGSPQPIFAVESIMDELAIKLNITPDEIRRRNCFTSGSFTASGQKLEKHDVNLIKVLDTAVQKSGFKEKWIKYHSLQEFKSLEHKNLSFNDADSLILKEQDYLNNQNYLRKGIGLAVSYRGCSLGAEGIDAAAAYLSLQNDGSLFLLCGLSENGQGLRTTLSIVAAEVLGLTLDKIIYLDQDTSLIPDSGPTVASRATLMGGGAVKNAAVEIRNRLEKLLVDEWNLAGDAVFTFANDKVKYFGGGAKEISFNELCALAYKKGISLSAMGWYKGPDVHWNEETGQGSAYFTYVYGCQVAEVTLNMATGEVFIDNLIAVHNPGRVINLLGAEGQVYGGVTQGAGYALWEEINSEKGFIKELNFDQYLIPTAKDVGKIKPYFIEGRDIYGPWGAKSLGEPTLELTAAAIANAVRNAAGKRFFNLPLNLEEIFLGKKLKAESLNRGSA